MRLRLPARIAIPIIFVACAGGGQLMKFENDHDLPRDLPPEVQEKFRVKEEVEAPSKSNPPIEEAKESSSLARGYGPKKRAKKNKKRPLPTSVSEPAVASAFPQPKVAAEVESPKPFVFPVRRPEKPAIWIGEKQVYDVSYFGVSAGDFVVRVLPFKVVSDRKVYHVEGTAVSSQVFSLFYRLNDLVETFIDYEGLFTHRFHILLDETKQARDALELNDSEKAQTFYWNRWQRKNQPYIETKEYFPVKPFSQDSLSALYYLRSLPLPDGAVVTFPVINEGKSWDAVVTVLRREMIDSPMGKVRAIVLKPEARYQGILKKQGDQYLWLTDDDRKFLVRLEAKVKIGTVVAKLKEVELGTPENK